MRQGARLDKREWLCTAAQGMLTGYKVLAFTQIVAGPTATKLMVEMGAEVIRWSRRPGDPARLNPVLRNGRSAYFST